MATSNSVTGNLSEFILEKDDWNNYIEQMEFFFQANGIEESNKKKAIHLSCCGSNTYKLFKSLAAPNKLTNTSYENINNYKSKHRSFRKGKQNVPQKGFHSHYIQDCCRGIDDLEITLFEKCETHKQLKERKTFCV